MSPRFFAHYWSYRGAKVEDSDQPFFHEASNTFRERGVKPGDFVYGWFFNQGTLFLIGRMQVDRYVSQREANALYDPARGAWKANDHVIARTGTATPMRFDRIVPSHTIRTLSFLDPRENVNPPKYFANGQVNHQTFRGVRELTREAAETLDRLIAIVPSQETIEQTVASDLDSLEEEDRREGGTSLRYSNYYERDRKLRSAAVRHHKTICKACGFDFEKAYGNRGADFIEVHHLRPISTLRRKTLVDPVRDMTVLCANCHRMVHRNKNKVLSVDELREIIKNQRAAL